jgi:hypothetical protein
MQFAGPPFALPRWQGPRRSSLRVWARAGEHSGARDVPASATELITPIGLRRARGARENAAMRAPRPFGESDTKALPGRMRAHRGRHIEGGPVRGTLIGKPEGACDTGRRGQGHNELPSSTRLGGVASRWSTHGVQNRASALGRSPPGLVVAFIIHLRLFSGAVPPWLAPPEPWQKSPG